ncbi:signal transduction histidine kinase [Streptomyces ambofaciens]
MATTPAPPGAPPKPTWDPRSATPLPWLRPTIRIRLTLLYGGMFLIAGILLLSIIYLLAAQAVRTGNEPLYKIVDFADLKVSSSDCPVVDNGNLSLSDFNAAISECMDHQRKVALDNLLSRSLLALLGLAVIAFAFGYAMAGRVLSPLGRITRTARAVAGSDLSRRIELDGPDDELKELADTFDDMLERLQRAFTAQQRFVGNASHELRTPLAINRTLLEVHLSDPNAPVELQQLGKTLLATNERSEQLVEGLLLLARSDNQIVERKPVDLAEVAGQAIDQVHGEAEAKGVEIRGTREAAVGPGQRRPAGADRPEPRPERRALQRGRPGLGGGHHGRGERPGGPGGHQHGPGRAGVRGGQPLRAVPTAAHRADGQRQGRRARAVHRALRGPGARRAHLRAAARGRRARDAGDPARLRS